LDYWIKGSGPAKLHPNVLRRIMQAREWKRFPPSQEWLKAQPAGLVREVLAAGDADEARSVRKVTHPGDRNRWLGDTD
jgi:hypothetical protein